MNRLRQILTVFLVGLTFFVMQAFGLGTLPAQATDTVKSPEGIYYKGTPEETGSFNNSYGRSGNNLVDSARRNLQETTGSTRNNLTSRQLGETVTSPEGIYYKGTPDERANINNNDNIQNDNQLVENARRNLKQTADSVRKSVSQTVNETARNIGETAQNIGSPVTTPEGNYYKAKPNKTNINNNNNLARDTGNPLKDTVENVREKLNLDEPLPRSTKEFLRSTEKRVEDTVEPITGRREGYYQEPVR
jgi:hypothetical protein